MFVTGKTNMGRVCKTRLALKLSLPVFPLEVVLKKNNLDSFYQTRHPSIAASIYYLIRLAPHPPM